MGRPVLVVGLAVTGEALVRHLTARGDDVTIVEDAPDSSEEYSARAQRARALGAVVVEHAAPARVTALAAAAELVVPSPGVPERHPAIAAARRADVPVRSEIDLAAEVPGPTLVAVTGTNGKTTVTTLTAEILETAGIRAIPAGNIGRPLLDAVHDHVDVVVAEVSSFQLACTTDVFRPRAAALLNLGADHLDWHRTFDAYAQAKSNIFANQRDDDVLVFNADDPVVAGLAALAPARRIPFSVAPGAAAGYRLLETARGTLLVGDDGEELSTVEALPRHSPVDLGNALAAAALARELGATPEAVVVTLTRFTGLIHRLQVVAEHEGIEYIDDSKATNVHATLAAVRGFDQVVLLAGGRNKGLDLTELRVLAPHLRAVVAIGEAAPDIVEAFEGLRPVVTAGSMREAVHAARDLASSGDVVLLSPACASFDWYPSYAARGDDFARQVHDVVEVEG